MKHPVRVLVVDDSALVRKIISEGLSSDPDIDVVGTAGDPYIARDKIVQLKPDVLTLDVEMPRMDGVDFLRRLMPQYPLPVLMVSALTQRGKRITLDALDAGAVDFISKPSADVARGLSAMVEELRNKVKEAAQIDVSHWKRSRPKKLQTQLHRQTALSESTDKVIAIGASTGGTQAIREIVTQFPATMPGVVIVQHMPAGFTRMFAERLNEQSAMHVKEAENGDRVMPGQVLIAPGDYHLQVYRSGGLYLAKTFQSDRVNGHRPSVEVLFYSIAKHVGSNAVGIILTGMGADGAKAMLKMHQEGARTFAQDEATSVVFGMPKVAWEIGAVDQLLPLEAIAGDVIQLFREK